jgi:hypothetical protein
MTNHYKIVYSATAEVVGLILKYLADKEQETEVHPVYYITRLL